MKGNAFEESPDLMGLKRVQSTKQQSSQVASLNLGKIDSEVSNEKKKFPQRKSIVVRDKINTGDKGLSRPVLKKRLTMKNIQEKSTTEPSKDIEELLQRISMKRVEIKQRKQKQKELKKSVDNGNGGAGSMISKNNFLSKIKQIQQEKGIRSSSSSSDESDKKANNNNNKRNHLRIDPEQHEFLKNLNLLDKSAHKKDQDFSPDDNNGIGKFIRVKNFLNEAHGLNLPKQISSNNTSSQNSTQRDAQNLSLQNDEQNTSRIQLSSRHRNEKQGKEGEKQSQDNQKIQQLQSGDMSVTIPQEQKQSNILSAGDHNKENDSQNEDADAHHSKLNFSLLMDDQIVKKSIPPFIINPATFWKTLWNIAMLLLILFLSLTVPYRIPFEDITSKSWLYCDIIIDFIFQIDLLFNFFTAYEDDNGELVVSRCKIAKNYIKSWFFIDLFASVPVSLILNLTGSDGSSNVLNIKFIKLTRLPRLYRLLRLLKLMRLYKSNKFIEKIMTSFNNRGGSNNKNVQNGQTSDFDLLAYLNISVATSKMIKSLVMIAFLLHLVGCLWATVATLTQGVEPKNWMIAANLDTAPDFDKYIASVYWAAVTIYTVGYGDITSQNQYELIANILILFGGVTLYTYIFSQLSALFSSVSSSDSTSKSRDLIISELAQRHRFTEDLTNKIQYFFQQNSNLISLSKEYEIDELLKILPQHLKSEISYFLYKDAIETIKILQGKDQRFYGDYLTKFEPMRIKSGTVFAKEGTRPQEVFFLLKGCVECEKQGKFYLEGTIFGESDIILKRNRQDSYIAKSDCYILKLERSIFEQIIDEFQDIRDEIQQIVAEREKKRLEQQQHAKFKGDIDNEYKELQKLMSLINFDQIQRKKSVSPQTSGLKQSFTSINPDGKLSNSRLIQSPTMNGPQSFLNIPKFSGTNLNAALQAQKDSIETESQNTIENNENKNLQNNASPSIKVHNIPRKSLVENVRMSVHLTNIENIKNNMILSFNKEEGIDKNKIEERLQETKNQIRMEHQINNLQDDFEDRDFNIEYGQLSGTKNNNMPLVIQSLPRIELNPHDQKKNQKKFYEGGQQEPIQDKNESSQNDDESIIRKLNFGENQGAFQDNDVSKLQENIQQCLTSIVNTRLLIKEYSSLFQTTIEDMGEDANEIIKKQYEQGRNCLESYMTIMNVIEKNISGINLQQVDQKISTMHVKCNDNEKRFYFLENRVKMIYEILSRKIKQLEKSKQRMLQQKPLIIVKRNPLLDNRDEKHTKQNEKLIDKSPMNL